MFFSVEKLVTDFGYLPIFVFIFIETALLVGFFLPGDSLLIAAGLYSALGQLNLGLVIIIASIAAVTGDTVAYYIGKKGGRKLFKRKESIFFSPDHLKRAETFFEKHGPVTVLIARPIAFLRTFAPVVAGMGNMHYRKFLAYNIVGGVIWVVAFTMFGWVVATYLSNVIDKSTLLHVIDYIILGIAIFSLSAVICVGVYKRITQGRSKGLGFLKKKLEKE